MTLLLGSMQTVGLLIPSSSFMTHCVWAGLFPMASAFGFFKHLVFEVPLGAEGDGGHQRTATE